METPFKWTAPDVANVVGTCCGACWNTVFSTRNTPSPPGGAGSSLVIETNSLQDIMALVALGKRWLECGKRGIFNSSNGGLSQKIVVFKEKNA